MTKQLTLFLQSAAVLGAMTVVSIATPISAHTPRDTPGYNPGSESAPPSFPFPLDRWIEVIGELRAIISQPAVPPNEPGIEFERPGFVRLDLKRQGSTPPSIAERFSRYAANLNTQGGQFTIFGNDKFGQERNIEVVLVPRFDRQMDVRFTSNSTALKGADGKPLPQTFTAPNARVAAVLAGVLPALDAANVSLETLQTAAKIVLSLGNVNLSDLEVQQLAQGLSESLIASEALLAGCGKDAPIPACTIRGNALAIATRAFNDVVNKSNRDALIALNGNSEFQSLRAALLRAREPGKQGASR